MNGEAMSIHTTMQDARRTVFGELLDDEIEQFHSQQGQHDHVDEEEFIYT